MSHSNVQDIVAQMNYIKPKQEYSMEKSVLIIIIFHNEASFNDTLETISSLQNIEYKNYKVIVINNGMPDGAKNTITLRYPWVSYLNSKRNLGFAGGNNLGIEYGVKNGYELLLILNNDVIVAPNFLVQLINKLNEDKRIGMVGPKTFYYDSKDKIWALGGIILKWRALIGGWKEDAKSFRKWDLLSLWSIKRKEKLILESGEIDYLPASCILVKREVILRVGKLPEEYFFAYEEADFALKVKRTGYKVVVEPKSHIWHKVGLSSKRTPELIYNSYRNRFLFLKRNFIFPLNLLLIVILFIAKIAQPKTNKKLFIEALFDHIKYKSIQEAHLLKVKQKYNS